jgi:putative nucleotidyltransferase-like protein
MQSSGLLIGGTTPRLEGPGVGDSERYDDGAAYGGLLMIERRYRESAAALLAGREAEYVLGPHDREMFVRWATRKRLAGLLWRAQAAADPEEGRDGLFDAACRQAAYSEYQERELRRVVGALARADISPIFLKGVALAYTIYPDAALRPRGDTDVLVGTDEAPGARTVFERLGYEPVLQPPGHYIASQFSVRRTDDRGIRYLFDVHLKISNVWAYADRLSYDEIRADAVPIGRLDSRALAPSAVHSFLIACVHRIAHHADTDELLWLYDIYLLAGAFTEAEWDQALSLTEAKGLCAVVLRGLERAEGAIGQPAPDQVMQRLRHAAAHEPPAPLVALDGSGARMIDVLLADFEALPGPRARLRLLAEHLLPPLSYMQRAYPRCPAALLPLAYAYRAARGAPRWFRRGGTE